MLTRALAQELGPYRIRVNAIAPSMVRTEFSRPSWNDPENLKRIVASIPIGRVAETEDLVGAALLLASDASQYITGHTIVIDGGILA
jgi:NAD(P)-dependent dehydrogenase (short-subunit alcohol dehydrogenase family)